MPSLNLRTFYSSANGGFKKLYHFFVMSIAFCTVRPSYFSLSLLENCLTFLLLNLCPYLPTASQGCKECGLGFLTGNTRVCVGKWCHIASMCCSNTMIFGPTAVHGIQLWCSVHINGISSVFPRVVWACLQSVLTCLQRKIKCQQKCIVRGLRPRTPNTHTKFAFTCRWLYGQNT